MNEPKIPQHKIEMAERLHRTLLLDTWPSLTTCTDFGITSETHYAALQYAVRTGSVTPRQLAAALGNGAAITALVRSAPDSPYAGVKFITPWDNMPLEPRHGLR